MVFSLFTVIRNVGRAVVTERIVVLPFFPGGDVCVSLDDDDEGADDEQDLAKEVVELGGRSVEVPPSPRARLAVGTEWHAAADDDRFLGGAA